MFARVPNENLYGYGLRGAPGDHSRKINDVSIREVWFRQLVLLIVVGAESSRSQCAPLAASRQPLVMPPKKQATAVVDHVDGVHYSLNLSSNMVCVGTGVVSNKEYIPAEDQRRLSVLGGTDSCSS